jgi:hypothetical protein
VHIQNPEKVIASASAALKPGGRLLWEEATASASFCFPENEYFNQWLALWRALREAKKTELDAGLKLPQWFRHSGLTNISTKIFHPILNTKKEKEIIWRNVAGTKSSAVEINFMSAKEIDLLIKELQSLTTEDHLMGFVRNSQTVGVRAPVSKL